jgi:DNA-binding transcriptional regulator YiaG
MCLSLQGVLSHLPRPGRVILAKDHPSSVKKSRDIAAPTFGWLVCRSGRRKETCMGRVEEAVRSEIMRLVRRELRGVVLPLGKEVRQLRRGLGRLTKSVAGLERVVAAQVREAEARRDRLEVSEEEAKTARLSARLIRALRTRLGISQGQLAVLVGVSTRAVTKWEQGMISPRGQNRATLVALRKLGRRDARRMLEQKGVAVPSKGRGRRAKGR